MLIGHEHLLYVLKLHVSIRNVFVIVLDEICVTASLLQHRFLIKQIKNIFVLFNYLQIKNLITLVIILL